MGDSIWAVVSLKRRSVEGWAKVVREIVTPGDLDLESRGRRDYWVALEHDSIWGEWHIPLTVFVGPEAQPGKGLVAFGATHGNEYEGPVAIKRLLHEIDAGAVRGRIVLVPVLNVPAFRGGARESAGQDGVNLNRAFVEGAGETSALAGITHRIVKFVRSCIWPQVHVVLDLHAGGTVGQYPPVVVFHSVDDPEQASLTLETARWFGTPFISLYQDLTPGLLSSESERLGKITIGCELGWGESVSRGGVRYARQGVLGAAILHQQLGGKIDPIEHHAAGTQRLVEMVDRACYVTAPWPGHYEPLVEAGAAVRNGQTVALLHDFQRMDEQPWPVNAGVDGYVLLLSARARVQPGQHILVVGQEVNWDLAAR